VGGDLAQVEVLSQRPSPPIFVWEPNDLASFGSVEEAESYLEPVDVRNDLYSAYDVEGRRLTLGITASSKKSLFGWRIERVTIACEESARPNRDELRAIFVTYLTGLAEVRDAAALSWEELLAAARRESGRDG
jgi:hypothetical protein